ncbi:cation transport regulator [Fictibacillus enclensis]|uniref:Cation transporter n=1 Tax=Fictibacillus enclensis TaxID=1017270 RepID=A0A0V8JDC4_9BACL|nr:ChaB family protein [Fictibacillus enclensis]KSU84913.1 cation transporter [Fictibacillus enclensis]SCB87754.1 cation transport regulator [Fictibacillus enclensis]
MPYDSLKELPDSVKDNLPHHAQEIFKAAFNSASEEYKEEETAFKVAWSAVKNKYEKNDNDEWVKKEE